MSENDHLNDVTTSFTILKPNTKIAQYRLIKTIGVGGMGEVYLAEDEQLKRKVALKFLLTNLSANEELKGRFLSEARSAAALNHPNIVTVYEVSEFNNNIFIAMEYVDGITLRGKMDSDQFDFDFILDVAIQICDGLSIAHQNKVIHRDIKPANILIDKTNRIRILDFGLAKSEADDNLTKDGTTIGTINYMSPEQCLGGKIDNRSDIFSFGILLYEMVTKKLPFKKVNIPATINSIMNDTPESASVVNPEVSSVLWEIIKKALAKKPEERYQDIINLKNDIINLKYGARIDDTAFNMPNAHLQMKTEVKSEEATETKTLAVLYLKNIGSEDNEYLSYGITEDLIVDLTRLNSLKVIPMRKIMKYKESDLDLEEIAELLEARYLIDGSIYKSQDSIRVSIQMFDSKTEDNLWAERWEEPLDELMKIKNMLASNISKFLEVGDSEVEIAEIGKPVANDAKAYDYYLKGKYLFEQRKDKKDVDDALDLFKHAITEEPSLLIAQIGTADINIALGKFNEAKTQLESAYKNAIEDEHLHNQAYILRLFGSIYQKQSDWQNAMTYANKALSLSKSNNDLESEIEIRGLIISILQPQLKFDEAIVQYDRVLELSRKIDDQEAIANALKNMGIVFSRKGDYTRALDLYDEANTLAVKHNNFVLQAACQSNIGNIYYYQGDLIKAYDQYMSALTIAERLEDNSLIARQKLNLGLIQLMQSNYSMGLQQLKGSADAFLLQGDKHNYVLALVNISQVYLIMGDTALAFKSAFEAFEISQDINQPVAEMDSLIRLGDISLEDNHIEDALNYFQKAKQLAKDVNNKRNLSLVEFMITKTYYKTQDYKNCVIHAKKSNRISKEIGEKNIINLSSLFLGLIDVVDGLYNIGIRQIETSISKLNEIGNYESILYAEILYSEIIILYGNSEEIKKSGISNLKKLLTIAVDKKMNQGVKHIKGLLLKYKDIDS